VNFFLKNHFCTTNVQIDLGCTKYFGMYKVFWDVQINLGCTKYFGMYKVIGICTFGMYKVIWDLGIMVFNLGGIYNYN
jgi:hypothetical protein